jgi:hypothetical protein
MKLLSSRKEEEVIRDQQSGRGRGKKSNSQKRSC